MCRRRNGLNSIAAAPNSRAKERVKLAKPFPLLRALGSGALAVILAAGAFWAGRVTVISPEIPISAPEPSSVAAANRTLGRNLKVPLAIEWTRANLPSPVTGIVTGLSDATQTIDEGDIVIQIDLSPTFAIAGDVPLTRSLSSGSQGADVETLQAYLARDGVLAPGDVDSRFGISTRRAVRQWQTDRGLRATGSIEAGTFLALQELPATISFSEGVGLGRVLTQGADMVDVIDPLPRLSSPLVESQRFLVGDLPVEIQLDEIGLSFQGVRYDIAADGTIALIVDGTPYLDCGARCASELEPGIDQLINASIELIPATDGVTVPITAVVIDQTDAASVVMANGDRRPVQLGIQDGKHIVVDGVEPGEMVRVFGTDA